MRSQRSLALILVLGVLAVVGLFAAGMFGAGQAIFGWRPQFTDAYTALGAADAVSRGSERERLVNAMADGAPPAGLKPGPRIHPIGTLARLRYEAIDADGQLVDRWDVRALVPPLPTIKDNAGAETPLLTRDGCPEACTAEVARGAVLLHRSGDPGIAYEWVLRMPLHTAFDLGSQPLITHDLHDPAPRRMPVSFVRRGDRDVPSPSNIRVTLVEACPARVRVGSETRLQFAPYAIVPIPTGFRTSRWVQLEGCGPIDALSHTPESSPSASAQTPAPAAALAALAPASAPIADQAPEIHAIVMRRNAQTGFASLRVDESWLSRHGKPVEFVLRGICRYDPAADTWTRLPGAGGDAHASVNATVRITPSTEGGTAERPVAHLPSEVALFWVQWIERAEHDLSARNQSFRDTLAPSGPIMCNDVDLGPAPAGRVPACVPFANRAEARFVPAPLQACAQ